MDALAQRAEQRDFDAPPGKWMEGTGGLGARLLLALGNRDLRRAHRQRMVEDVVRYRGLLEDDVDDRVIDLAVWSEHVETLHKSLKKGNLETFHYVRALEATCRRCGFNLLPLMGEVEQLGQVWGGRDLKKTYKMVSPHFEEANPPREAT